MKYIFGFSLSFLRPAYNYTYYYDFVWKNEHDIFANQFCSWIYLIMSSMRVYRGGRAHIVNGAITHAISRVKRIDINRNLEVLCL